MLCGFVFRLDGDYCEHSGKYLDLWGFVGHGALVVATAFGTSLVLFVNSSEFLACVRAEHPVPYTSTSTDTSHASKRRDAIENDVR